MILKAECTIDIDEKRKIWIEMSAKPDGEDPEEIIPELAAAVAEATLASYAKLIPKFAVAREDPLRTFGEDE